MKFLQQTSLRGKETARAFGTSWDRVFHAVQMAVKWGRAHVNLLGISAIGIDEIAWQKECDPCEGHRYVTLVYQIDTAMKRLLWLGRDRTS